MIKSALKWTTKKFTTKDSWSKVHRKEFGKLWVFFLCFVPKKNHRNWTSVFYEFISAVMKLQTRARHGLRNKRNKICITFLGWDFMNFGICSTIHCFGLGFLNKDWFPVTVIQEMHGLQNSKRVIETWYGNCVVDVCLFWATHKHHYSNKRAKQCIWVVFPCSRASASADNSTTARSRPLWVSCFVGFLSESEMILFCALFCRFSFCETNWIVNYSLCPVFR